MWEHVLRLVLALIALSFGADLLVRGSVALARTLRVSPLFVGLTIVGFGTSTPELGTSVLAALRGLDDLAVGNVVGSNIFNIAVILGIAACWRPIRSSGGGLRSEVAWALAAACMPLVALLGNRSVGRVTGGVLLLGLAVYITQSYCRSKNETTSAASPTELEFHERPPAWRSVGVIVLGLAVLMIGSFVLVDAASAVATELGMSQLAIGLTIVAAGTSAPELFTSLAATRRNEMDVAIGNVIGSNIFNVFGILGLTSLVRPQVLQVQTMALDVPMMLLASLCLVPLIWQRGRIPRAVGMLLVGSYVTYVVVLLVWAPEWFGPGAG